MTWIFQVPILIERYAGRTVPQESCIQRFPNRSLVRMVLSCREELCEALANDAKANFTVLKCLNGDPDRVKAYVARSLAEDAFINRHPFKILLSTFLRLPPEERERLAKDTTANSKVLKWIGDDCLLMMAYVERSPEQHVFIERHFFRAVIRSFLHLPPELRQRLAHDTKVDSTVLRWICTDYERACADDILASYVRRAPGDEAHIRKHHTRDEVISYLFCI